MTRDEWLWCIGSRFAGYGHRGAADVAVQMMEQGLVTVRDEIEVVVRNVEVILRMKNKRVLTKKRAQREK